MLYFLLAAGIVWGLPTIYLAYRFKEFTGPFDIELDWIAAI
jgi:hypothetical protein